MESQEILCRIYGKVQMVMFRDFVQRNARMLELSGYVRNDADGSVEILAQGGKEKLQQLVECLKKGPLLASVLRVDVEWRAASEQRDGFKIVY